MITKEDNDRNVAALGECWDDATLDEKLDLIRTERNRENAKAMFIEFLGEVYFTAAKRAHDHALKTTIAAIDKAFKGVQK